MRAMTITGPSQMVVTDVPKPEPGPGEVVVKVAYSGICGSDLRAYQNWGGSGIASHWGGNTIFGHEFSGTISAVAPDVEGLEVGQPVAVRGAGYCGDCFWCHQGQLTLCPDHFPLTLGIGKPGGFAEYVKMPAAMARPLPEGADLMEVAVTEPLAVSIRGVRHGKLGIGDDVVIFGAGPIGQLTLQAARLAGAGHITVVEPSEPRRLLAAELGADRVLEPHEVDSPGFAEIYSRGGPDVVFECSGVGAANQKAIDIVRPAGRVVLVGGIPSPLQIQLIRGPEIAVSIGYDVVDFEDAINFIVSGKVNVRPLITAVVPLEEGPKAFAELASDRKHVKVLLQA